MIRATVAIGVFPIVAIGGLAMVRLEHKYQSIASEISKHSATAVPTPTGDEQTIYDIPVDDIRYIEALQNYAKIVYVGADGTLQHKTERTTMIRLQEQLHGTPVVKCHRSYLVNKTAIKSATGNAQGLQLTLLGCDKQVPVSRSKVPVFRGL